MLQSADSEDRIGASNKRREWPCSTGHPGLVQNMLSSATGRMVVLADVAADGAAEKRFHVQEKSNPGRGRPGTNVSHRRSIMYHIMTRDEDEARGEKRHEGLGKASRFPIPSSIP
ncbi:hypothetical protein E4U54_008210 [Claviceps lovelessii]|nr:hypothetical protein E4U54_008210 [Claviceps lovelessii]